MPNAEFAVLQSRLRAFWPQMTLRSIGDIERAVVAAHGRNEPLSAQLVKAGVDEAAGVTGS
jgi:hypothetical protein